MNAKNNITLEDSIVDLYLSVKLRKQDDMNNISQEDLTLERQNLKRINPITIIEYIKSTINSLINLKVEEKFNLESKKVAESVNSFNTSLNELIVNNTHVKNNSSYENIIKELENQVRRMIKSEQYLKIQLGSLQTKYDHLEKNYDELSKAFEMKSTYNDSRQKSRSRTPTGDISSRMISNPINYNFNNPIVIYGHDGKRTIDDSDTVNVSYINYMYNSTNLSKQMT